MKKLSRTFAVLALVCAFVGISMMNVSAASTSFGGKAGYGYEKVSSPNIKADSNNLAYVNWTYSDQNSHKMWFKVCKNGYTDSLGKALVNYQSSDYITTSGTVKGGSYVLYAGREHVVNPETYVSGTWES